MEGKTKATAHAPARGLDDSAADSRSELHGLPTTVRAAHETSFDDWGSGLPVPAPADAEGSEWGESPTLAPASVDALAGDADFETVRDPRIPPGQAFFKIGEVAKIVGVKAYVLRYWEGELAVIRPEKTSTRQRRYRRQDVAMLLQVCRLRHDEKLSIARIRVLLRRNLAPGTSLGLDPSRPQAQASQTPSSAITPAARAGLQDQLQDMRRAVMAMLEAVED